jgi:hypothetical protein
MERRVAVPPNRSSWTPSRFVCFVDDQLGAGAPDESFGSLGSSALVVIGQQVWATSSTPLKRRSEGRMSDEKVQARSEFAREKVSALIASQITPIEPAEAASQPTNGSPTPGTGSGRWSSDWLTARKWAARSS